MLPHRGTCKAVFEAHVNAVPHICRSFLDEGFRRIRRHSVTHCTLKIFLAEKLHVFTTSILLARGLFFDGIRQQHLAIHNSGQVDELLAKFVVFKAVGGIAVKIAKSFLCEQSQRVHRFQRGFNIQNAHVQRMFYSIFSDGFCHSRVCVVPVGNVLQVSCARDKHGVKHFQVGFINLAAVRRNPCRIGRVKVCNDFVSCFAIINFFRGSFENGGKFIVKCDLCNAAVVVLGFECGTGCLFGCNGGGEFAIVVNKFFCEIHNFLLTFFNSRHIVNYHYVVPLV
nr:MAG TPA: hypothetical protein [Bacteriophage sp.]